MNEKIIIISGPTAVGKKDVLQHITLPHSSIISADSMKVYKYMKIGTAAPSTEDIKKYNIKLIGIVNPDDEYNAGRFVRDARKIIKNSIKEKRIPIIFGGTGLYIDSLLYGIFDIQEVDKKIREEVYNDFHIRGREALYKELKEKDPESAKKIHINDTQRLLRYIELLRAFNEKPSILQKKYTRPYKGKSLYIVLYREKQALYDRIYARVNKMLNLGFIEEVKRLIDMNYSPELKSMRSLGYRHFSEYLRGLKNLDEAISQYKIDTRKFAKRQLTWFRKNNNALWIHADNYQKIDEVISKFIKN